MISKMTLAASLIMRLATPAFAGSFRNDKGKFIECVTAASAKALRIDSENWTLAELGTSEIRTVR